MADLFSDLTALLGPDRVSVAPDVLATHSIDKWHASAPPDVVVLARERDDVVKTLRYAHEHGVPVTTRGAGVGYVGGVVPVRGGIVLSVRGMDRIVEIHTGDGVAVVEPGAILNDLQQAARAKGWYYPPDPASLKECSIGGNIAANAGGPRCLKYGVTRHYVLGLEVVLANGEVLVTGGR
ncbi:MAG: FAD-binding protein, partial [Verrucomicrobiae bacterium]|nr:FAD-binding protein [Verrucomicrobiae bacterium]